MKRRIVLVSALVAGLLAALLTRLYISAKEADFQAQKDALNQRFGTIDVLAFSRDVPAGTTLSASDLGLMKVPKLGLRGLALTLENKNDVIGRRTLVGHRAKEVLIWSDVEGGNPGARSLSADVKPKMRAVSINCNLSSSVSGMVRPNDHVDVIGTFNFPGEDGNAKKGELVTCTILQNVLVLATGKDTSKSLAREYGAVGGQGYSTVTLSVTPREAEMLAFAEQIKGRLVLTLRNRNDTSTESELPNVDFSKIRSEIEELNLKRQQLRLGSETR